MRKVIQVSAVAMAPIVTRDEERDFEEELRVTALCDDGSVWLIRPDKIKPIWEQLPGIPQKP